jgi:hypothetical protein
VSHATGLEPVLPFRKSYSSAFRANEKLCLKQLVLSEFFHLESPVQVHLQPIRKIISRNCPGGSSSNYKVLLLWSAFTAKENFGSCNGLEEVLPIRNSGTSAFPANKKLCLMQLCWREFVQSESPVQEHY